MHELYAKYCGAIIWSQLDLTLSHQNSLVTMCHCNQLLENQDIFPTEQIHHSTRKHKWMCFELLRAKLAGMQKKLKQLCS